MGRRSGSGGRKPPPFLSPSSSKRSRPVRRLPSIPKPPLALVAPFTGRRRKKAPARLWMRMDRWGGCEVFMCDKAFVAERSGVHIRDLCVVGPLLSRSPSILAREKAMVINLELIRAIVTADEVLLLEPLAQEVLPFVDKLRQHFPLKSLEVDVGARHVDDQDGKYAKTGAESELPFEFQVLELALEAVCLSFNSSVSDLNRHAIFVLDELTKNLSTRNLERVRSLKSNLTSLLASVHKVRDEVEHVLDDNENMTRLHISRKQTKSQQDEALLSSAFSNSNFPPETSLARPNSIIKQSMGIATSVPLDSDADNLEMLLEAYFMQLDGIRNRLVSVCSFISPNLVLHESYHPQASIDITIYKYTLQLSYFFKLVLIQHYIIIIQRVFILFIMDQTSENGKSHAFLCIFVVNGCSFIGLMEANMMFGQRLRFLMVIPIRIMQITLLW
ncbi:putative magnesium transporter MRS2-H isoform X1 [Phragmites australis]|uniref:putative magnesium transporter MRS2-H isoform X1 n=1 Tax=Phragmites australis TaxID=29695 RepID=UPI002D7A34CE|nr:putative magnesium transporter MRS2-H isoform X1 [Phragmites australis]